MEYYPSLPRGFRGKRAAFGIDFTCRAQRCQAGFSPPGVQAMPLRRFDMYDILSAMPDWVDRRRRCRRRRRCSGIRNPRGLLPRRWFPPRNEAISNAPMGPFHMTVLEDLIFLLNNAIDSGLYRVLSGCPASCRRNHGAGRIVVEFRSRDDINR